MNIFCFLSFFSRSSACGAGLVRESADSLSLAEKNSARACPGENTRCRTPDAPPTADELADILAATCEYDADELGAQPREPPKPRKPDRSRCDTLR